MLAKRRFPCSFHELYDYADINMLLEFTVSNFRSIRDEATLSLVAAKLSARKKEMNEHHLFKTTRDGVFALSSAVVYGANASGKSNLFQALLTMRSMVEHSARSMPGDPIEVVPFRLDVDTLDQPTRFEVVFIHDDEQYRYGFEANQTRIHREWLYVLGKRREARLFIRDGNDINRSRSFGGRRSLEEQTSENVLFLSLAAQLNHNLSRRLVRWFSELGFLNGVLDRTGIHSALAIAHDPQFAARIQTFMNGVDSGTEGISIDEEVIEAPEGLSEKYLKAFENQRLIRVHTEHSVRGATDGLSTSFSMLADESNGTQKLFAWSLPIIDTLDKGGLLFIDELDARLHPMLSHVIVELFNSPKTNPNRAQLVAFTHDTQFLDPNKLRRDQIWFVEKNRAHATDLFSLADIHVRNDHQYSKRYLQGFYGAVPNVQTLIVPRVSGE